MLKTLILIKKGLAKLLEYTVIVLMGTLVLDVLWGVISRMSGSFVVWLAGKGIEAWALIPRGQAKWTEELAIYLLIWVSLLGSSVAFAAKAHLGVDYLTSKLDGQAARLMEVLVNLLAAFFAAAAFIWGGWVLVSETLEANQVSPALGIKVGYIYLSLPISGIFIVIFALESIVEIMTGRRMAASGSEED
jgi:TRAP-type C4-dicarboxylate transport system permease small subunit